MTIQEALKSGKPFRRQADTITHAWIKQIGSVTGKIHWLDKTVAGIGLNADDILADDWELKE